VVTIAGVTGVAAGAGIVALVEQRLSSDIARAVIIAFAVLTFTALAKWLWKAILRQMHATISDVNQGAIDELGASIGKKIDDLSTRNDQQHRDTAEQLGALEEQVRDVVRVQDEQAKRLDDGSTAMKSLLGQLNVLATDVAALRSPQSPAA
jgi:uncharacterized membrane protein YccC